MAMEFGDSRKNRRTWTLASWDATTVSRGKTASAGRMVPYAETSEAELAEASMSGGTRFGTEASLAGVHISVNNSRKTEAANKPRTVWTNGRTATMSPRPMSQTTINFLRSHRSRTAVANAPKKNPGRRRPDSTTPTATAWLDLPTAPARDTTARNPTQSPNDDTTWAVNSLRYGPANRLARCS